MGGWSVRRVLALPPGLSVTVASLFTMLVYYPFSFLLCEMGS